MSTETKMTRDEALAIVDTKWWMHATDRQIAEFQLHEDRLCCPFDVFHQAVEKALGRPVWTHEFAYPDGLRAELAGDKPPASLQEIMDLIPPEKRIIVKMETDQDVTERN